MHRMKITELDHIVLNVDDIERSLRFYIDVLGLQPERVEEFHAGKVGFPSVRVNERTIIDLFPSKDGAAEMVSEKVKRNLNHFCLVAGSESFAGIVDYLAQNQVTVREGPVSRWGAQGRATSVYFPDPDGNEIEIRCYDRLE